MHSVNKRSRHNVTRRSTHSITRRSTHSVTRRSTQCQAKCIGSHAQHHQAPPGQVRDCRKGETSSLRLRYSEDQWVACEHIATAATAPHTTATAAAAPHPTAPTAATATTATHLAATTAAVPRVRCDLGPAIHAVRQ